MAYLVSEFKPTPTYRKFDKVKLDCKLSGKCLVFHSNILISWKIAEFRTPTFQDIRKKGSEFLKLPPVRNCFTLTMTNKLVVIINSLKYQKLRKFYYMEWNYSCLQNPSLGGYRSHIPVLSVLNWICWNPPPNKTPGYATAVTVKRTDNVKNISHVRCDTSVSFKLEWWPCGFRRMFPPALSRKSEVTHTAAKM